ncbi:MAG: CPBP family intramembrane metalloprotease [Candidatus Lokiarchaeota archaeon]|nr:CPBP family intramembrane metalloprotease [Candidatus Lokiarchaeota archaeon]
MSTLNEKLQNTPLITIPLIIGIYWGFLLLPRLFLLPFYSLPYPWLLLGDLIFKMILLTLLWFLLIPFGLQLPSKNENLLDYSNSIKLNKFSPELRNISIGIAFAVIILFTTLIPYALMGVYQFDISTIIGQPNRETGALGYFTFISNLQPAIWEEIAFRGVILVLLLNAFSNKNAIVIDGLAFGLFHLINLFVGADPLFTLYQVFFATCLGIVLAYMTVKFKTLIPAMMAHYINNAFQPLVSNAMVADYGLEIILSIIRVLVYTTLGFLLIYYWPKRDNGTE